MRSSGAHYHRGSRGIERECARCGRHLTVCGHDEIKTHMLEREETIRSRTPASVMQEIWGILITFNLIRREMVNIAKQADVPPTRISFVTAMRFIRLRARSDRQRAPRARDGRAPLATRLAAALSLATIAFGCGSESSAPSLAAPSGDEVMSNLTSGQATHAVDEFDDNGLHVLSLSYSQDDQNSIGSYFTEWFGTVVNDADSVRCPSLARMTTTYRDGTVYESIGTTRAASFLRDLDSGEPVTTECLAPGEQGVLYANAVLDEPHPVDDVFSIEVAEVADYESFRDARSDPDPPTLEDVRWSTESPDREVLEATLVAGGRPILNPGVDFFLVDADGGIHDRLSQGAATSSSSPASRGSS